MSRFWDMGYAQIRVPHTSRLYRDVWVFAREREPLVILYPTELPDRTNIPPAHRKNAMYGAP